MYHFLIKPILFLFNPEKVHYAVMGILKFLLHIPGGKFLFRSMYCVVDKKLERKILGLTFPNPVGLAAGFDKDAKWFNDLGYLGFGFVEIGTVTPIAQPGNDKPRLFRLPADAALINRMGFNNEGASAAAMRLREQKPRLIIGGNIGKNKNTSAENAVDDYLKCFRVLREVVDYFVVNVSSPNTPGLRSLQEKEPLLRILHALVIENKNGGVVKPILLKIAPDLNEAQLDDIIEIVKQTRIEGVIATNTTISRDGLKTQKEEVDNLGAGGLSGVPLRDRSTEVIRYLAEMSKKSFVIIGVGGIHSAKDAKEKLDAGADLVQLYTGFIYEGPGIVAAINKSLLAN